jgi:hypothetical protein
LPSKWKFSIRRFTEFVFLRADAHYGETFESEPSDSSL